MRVRGVIVATSMLLLALWSESRAFDPDQPSLWVPDLLTGLALFGCGLVALRLREAPGPGLLLMATSATWFLGAWPIALYLHRGPLVHLIVAFAGWRGRTRLDTAAIAVGYVAALSPAVWGDDRSAAFLTLFLTAVAGIGLRRAQAPDRPERRTALIAAAALSLVLLGGIVARARVPENDAVVPSLATYQLTLILVAVLLVTRIPARPAAAVIDTFVALDVREGGIRARLADVLADPTIEVGFWSPAAEAYLDPEGGVVAVVSRDPDTSMTYVQREGQPFAVLVHDRQALQDPALTEAISGATRLLEQQRALREAVAEQVQQIGESSRRLLNVSDEQRRALADRLAFGPERRLAEIERALSPLAGRPGMDNGLPDHLARARQQRLLTARELADIAAGLHPRALARGGLVAGLRQLADLSPLPVDVTADLPNRLSDEVAVAAYYVCAEALTNAAKHSGARRARVSASVAQDALVLVVGDDGIGGADPAAGTGLTGLSDRVEALGGTLTVSSERRAGTRVEARLPIR